MYGWMDVRMKYISRSSWIFSLGLIRGIENIALFTYNLCDALAAVRHTRLISFGTCGKTLHAVRKNCSRPKNIEIRSKKRTKNV